PAFEALKTDTSSREGMHYAALFAALEEMGLPRAEIVSATMFTVNDPATEMDLARDWIMAQPLPTVGNWRLRRISGSEIRAAAEFDTYELLDGDPPYSELGSARIHFDPDGTPAVVNRVTVQVGISYPAGEIPVGGHPVVLYGHGTGGDAETHFGAEGAALAEQGIATLGFEAALHGGRVPAPIAVENLIGENPIAAREVVRQTVLDMVLIYRMIAAGAFTLPADLNRGTEVPLAASPVMYMGHSQGSQEAGVLMGLEPSLQASFLSEGGMSAIITIEERELTAGSPIKCLIASLVQEDCSLMTEDHPLITLIIQPLLEPADPAVFAHRFLRERDASWAPLSIAMTEGTADPFTPPRGIEALAVATGLPLVAPVVQATEPFMLTGTMTATPPVVDNLTSSSSAMVTGGLMQFEGQGHFAIYELEDAKRRYVEFFHTFVLDGTPTIVGP
ncbi:MAG: alpha/beta hydrolase family protein, partial [Sandaracinaceae bacterium]